MTPFPTTENPPPAKSRQPRNEEQAPLGADPSYDDVLDVAVQYTFPCSDPIAVDQCCHGHPEREEGAAKGPGTTAGHGSFIEL